MTKSSLRIVLFLAICIIAALFFIYKSNNSSLGYQTATKLYSLQNYDEAIQHFESLAKNNDSNALFALGMIYMDKNYPKMDEQKGKSYLELAAKLGNLYANNNLYYYYTNSVFDDDSDVSEEQILIYLKEAANLGGYKANIILSAFSGEENNFVNPKDTPDYEIAEQYALKAKNIKSTPETNFLLGAIYTFDEKSNEHFEEGVSLLRQSYKDNFPIAGLALEELSNQGKISNFSLKSNSFDAFMDIMDIAERLTSAELLPIYSILSETELNSLIKELEDESTEQDSKAIFALYDIYNSNYNTYDITDKNRASQYLKDVAKYSDEAKYQLFMKASWSERDNYIPLLKEAAENGYVPAIIEYFDKIKSNFYDYDEDEQRSFFKVFKQLQTAANNNDQESTLALAHFYKNGIYGFDVLRNDRKAIQLYKQVLKNDPNNIIANEALADYYFDDLEYYVKALPFAQKYIAAKPNDKKGQNRLGKILFYLKRVDEAIPYLTASLSESYYNDFETYKMLGLAWVDDSLKDKKDYSKAIEYLNLALEKYRGYGYGFDNIYATLGDIYYDGFDGVAPDHDKALSFYKIVLKNFLKEQYLNVYQRYIELSLANNTIDESVLDCLKFVAKYDNSIDYKSILLKAEPKYEFVKSYIFDFYNLYKAPELRSFIQNKAESGDKDYRFYFAAIEFNENNDKTLLEHLAKENNQAALEFLYQNDNEHEYQWLEQLVKVSGEDKFIYLFINYLSDLNRFEEVLVWYEKMKDKDYSFIKSRVERAQNKIDEIKSLKEKMKQNDPAAFFKMYQIIGNKNWHESEPYLKKAADLGLVKAQLTYAEILSGLDDVKKQKQAVAYYQKAAEKNEHKAVLELGKKYLIGNGVPLDREKAKTYFRQADKIKPNYMADDYLDNMSRFEKLSLKIENDTNQKAEAKDLYTLARYYLNNQFVKQDLAKYKKFMQASAELGYQSAQQEIAVNYIVGRNGFDIDVEKGINYLKESQVKSHWLMKYYTQYYLPAQNKQDMDAQFNLGKYYLSDNTFDTPYFISLSEKLIREAAEQNSGPAQLYLYEQSPKNSVEAKTWLNKALNNPSSETLVALATSYSKGRLKDVQPETIKTILQKAAQIDNKYYYTLAMFYLVREKDDQQAVSALESYQKVDSSKALKEIANIYQNQSSTLYQPQKAIEIYQRLYQGGDYSVGNNLADLLYVYDPDINKSLDWKVKTLDDYLAFANNQDQLDFVYNNMLFFSSDSFYEQIANDYYNLASSIENGIYSETDYDPSRLYLQAFKLNNDKAAEALSKWYLSQLDLDNAYIYGVISNSQNLELLQNLLDFQKRELLDKKIEEIKTDMKYSPYINQVNTMKNRAEKYGANSAIEYADVLFAGEITPKDVAQGIAVLEQAGSKGYAFAYNRLGNIFKSGLNDQAIDINKAIYYFDLGAKLNDSNCAHQAGDIYYFGMEGIPKDYVKAMAYFDQTDPEKGRHHGLAKYKMAYMYYNGLGVEKNISKAYELLKIGEEYGDQRSIEALTTWNFNSNQ